MRQSINCLHLLAVAVVVVSGSSLVCAADSISGATTAASTPLDATNHKAEQAIRPAVGNRRVWGGNRTEVGANAQSILMSVIFTAMRQNRDVLAFISQVLTARADCRPLLLGG